GRAEGLPVRAGLPAAPAGGRRLGRRMMHGAPHGRGGEESTGLRPTWLAERERGDRVERDLRVPEALDCWPGHFPVWRIVPGVVQIEWAMEALAARLGDVRLLRVERRKFKRPLTPGARRTLVL